MLRRTAPVPLVRFLGPARGSSGGVNDARPFVRGRGGFPLDAVHPPRAGFHLVAHKSGIHQGCPAQRACPRFLHQTDDNPRHQDGADPDCAKHPAARRASGGIRPSNPSRRHRIPVARSRHRRRELENRHCKHNRGKSILTGHRAPDKVADIRKGHPAVGRRSRSATVARPRARNDDQPCSSLKVFVISKTGIMTDPGVIKASIDACPR